MCVFADAYFILSLVAWDVMSQVTFSKDLGILDAGSDYRKILKTSSKSLDYFASVSVLHIGV